MGCQTWVSLVPRNHVRFVSDTAWNVGGACSEAGGQVEQCCPEFLGGNIVTAQRKREHIHLKLGSSASSFPDTVRWIVSTEQDVWWNVPALMDFLDGLERQSPKIHEFPAFVGHWYGPFLVFNRQMLARSYGNGTFMSACRKLLT